MIFKTHTHILYPNYKILENEIIVEEEEENEPRRSGRSSNPPQRLAYGENWQQKVISQVING